MSSMKATDLLIDCLENEGVDYVFGIMGKETLDLMDSLSKSKQITYINVRHEQGAAFMADVYGRLSKSWRLPGDIIIWCYKSSNRNSMCNA